MYLYQASSQGKFIVREHKSLGSLVAREAPTSRRPFDSRGARDTLKSFDSRRARKALTELTDNRLISRLEKLRGEERAVQLKILYYLNEMERRRLYLPRGYSSLFEFCTGHLKYSKPAAWRRIQAARCIERFPKVAKLLLSGELSLTTVSMISKILTPENAAEILPWAVGKSTRDIEALISRHQPGRIEKDRIKPVCIMTPCKPRTSSECQADLTFGSGAGTRCKASFTSSGGSKILENKSDAGNTGGKGSSSEEELERVMITQKYRLEFAVDPEFMQKLEKIKSLLSNKHPRGIGFEALFNMLMDEYLEKHAPEARAIRREQRKKRSSDNTNRRNAGKERRVNRELADKKCNNKTKQAAKRRCISDPDAQTRHIPKALQDKVYTRDKGRCTYRGPGGKRCGSRRNLQIDHIVPYARGGKHTLDNLRLLCAKHNRLEAEREYGIEFMKKYVQKE